MTQSIINYQWLIQNGVLYTTGTTRDRSPQDQRKGMPEEEAETIITALEQKNISAFRVSSGDESTHYRVIIGPQSDKGGRTLEHYRNFFLLNIHMALLIYAIKEESVLNPQVIGCRAHVLKDNT